MEVVINRCFGGFSISDAAVLRCAKLGLNIGNRPYDNKYRCHPTLIQIVRELGEEANGDYAELKIVDIPFDGVYGWEVNNYDGKESIVETHRSWY